MMVNHLWLSCLDLDKIVKNSKVEDIKITSIILAIKRGKLKMAYRRSPWMQDEQMREMFIGLIDDLDVMTPVAIERACFIADRLNEYQLVDFVQSLRCEALRQIGQYVYEKYNVEQIEQRSERQKQREQSIQSNFNRDNPYGWLSGGLF